LQHFPATTESQGPSIQLHPLFHQEPLEDSYETAPSEKPTQLRYSIELQPSSTLNLQNKQKPPKIEKEKEKLNFQHSQPFMMINCPLTWHFLLIILL
jgi:hypothetical protein